MIKRDIYFKLTSYFSQHLLESAVDKEVYVSKIKNQSDFLFFLRLLFCYNVKVVQQSA